MYLNVSTRYISSWMLLKPPCLATTSFYWEQPASLTVTYYVIVSICCLLSAVVILYIISIWFMLGCNSLAGVTRFYSRWLLSTGRRDADLFIVCFPLSLMADNYQWMLWRLLWCLHAHGHYQLQVLHATLPIRCTTHSRPGNRIYHHGSTRLFPNDGVVSMFSYTLCFIGLISSILLSIHRYPRIVLSSWRH